MRAALSRLKPPDDEPLRVAVLGIGHPLNGDDAAGPAVVAALRAALPVCPHVLILDGGPAPENQTGPLRAFQPDLVLFVDAAQMDAPPGTVRWLDWRETSGLSASTHTLPPYLLAQFLVAELGCAVALLGIQPAQNVAEGLSPAVQAAVAHLSARLASILAAQC